MTAAIYIPSKGRPENMRRVIPAWLEFKPRGVKVIVVVDNGEHALYRDTLRAGFAKASDDIHLLKLPYNNRGIGFARAWSMEHAAKMGHESVIMSDDDVRPRSSVNPLLREARKASVLGIGATSSYHSLLSNGWTDVLNCPILCPGGWGFQLFGLNVANTIKVGNFVKALDCFGEDAELMRNGIANGFCWQSHCGVSFAQIGKRYEPGGIAALYGHTRTERERDCQEMIHARWPMYTSKPPKPSRMAWQRMYDDYLPGWRRRSAIHGGSLRARY